MQSIDSIETYAYGIEQQHNDIMQVKEKIKRYNIIRRCLTSTMSQNKT